MGTAKGRVAGSKNVAEADFIAASLAGDSYESVGEALGLKPDTVMNRAASLRKVLATKGATEAQLAKIGPKYKTRGSVGDAALSIL